MTNYSSVPDLRYCGGKSMRRKSTFYDPFSFSNKVLDRRFADFPSSSQEQGASKLGEGMEMNLN